MGGAMTPEAALTLKLLDGGEWHDYETVVQQVAVTVAPGRALRKFDSLRAAAQRRLGPRQGPEPSDDEKIASGQRNYAVAAMNSLKERHLEVVGEGPDRRVRKRQVPLLVSRSGKQKQVCNVPEHRHRDQVEQDEVVVAPPGEQGRPAAGPEPCATCGLYIANHEQHEEFHKVYDAFLAERGTAEPLPSSGEMGLFDEAAVRALIRQEVTTVLGIGLDEFQRGMQSWMLERFAALEEVLGAKIPQPEQRRHARR